MASLSTNSRHVENETREEVPLTAALKNLGITLSKQVKDLFNKSFKILKKKTE